MKSDCRIKLFFANGIGDLILALPTIRAFATSFATQCSLIIGDDVPIELTRELNIPLEIVESHWVSGHRCVSLLNELGSCDIFISLVQWDHSSIHRLGETMSARLTIGHFDSFDLCRPLLVNRHCVEQTFSFFKTFVPDAKSTDFCWPLVFTPFTEAAYRRLRAVFHTSPLLIAHFDTANAKLPPMAWIDRVLVRVKEAVNCYIVLVGEVSRIDCKPSVDAELLDSLELCMLLSSRADAFFGADSCMLHVADLHRRPLVATFLTTNEAEFGARSSPYFRHITAAVDGYCEESAITASRYLCEMLRPSLPA